MTEKRIPEQRYRFGILLHALVALFAGTGLLDYTQQLLPPRLILAAAGLLLIFVLVAAVVNVSGGRRSVPTHLARGLVVVTVLVQVVSVALDNRDLGLVAQALALLLIGYATVLVLQFLVRATTVDTDMIYASICVYLLMSVAWALWYSLLFFLEPGCFAEGHELVTFGQRTMPGELYYSLVTITTLGYGDVTPLTTAARMSAALEAVVGQVYVIVLVARLVGLNVSQARSET